MKPLHPEEQKQIDDIFAKTIGFRILALIDVLNESQCSRRITSTVMRNLYDALGENKIYVGDGVVSVTPDNGSWTILYSDITYADEETRTAAVAEVVEAIELVTVSHSEKIKTSIVNIITKMPYELHIFLSNTMRTDKRLYTPELMLTLSNILHSTTTEVTKTLTSKHTEKPTEESMTKMQLNKSLNQWETTFELVLGDSPIAQVAMVEWGRLNALINFFNEVTCEIEGIQQWLIKLIELSDNYCRTTDAVSKNRCFVDIMRHLFVFFPDVIPMDVGLIVVLIQILYIRVNGKNEKYTPMYSQLRKAMCEYLHSYSATRNVELMATVEKIIIQSCLLDKEIATTIGDSLHHLEILLAPKKSETDPELSQITKIQKEKCAECKTKMTL